MLVKVYVGVRRGCGCRSVLGPAEDEVTVSSGGRDLGARLTILRPHPAVDATVDNLEMGGVDLLVQDAVRSIAGVEVRRDVGTVKRALVGEQNLQ